MLQTYLQLTVMSVCQQPKVSVFGRSFFLSSGFSRFRYLCSVAVYIMYQDLDHQSELQIVGIKIKFLICFMATFVKEKYRKKSVGLHLT
jgi:hypothetical protein